MIWLGEVGSSSPINQTMRTAKATSDDRPHGEGDPQPPSSQTHGKPRRVANVLWNWAGYLVSAVMAFFLSPFIVHRLGDTGYGIWVLLGSLVGYLGLLDLGVRGAVTRYVARFHARYQHREAIGLTSSALVIFTATGLLAIGASVGLAVFVADLFQVPEGMTSVARIVVILGGINIAVSLVSGVFGGVLSGIQRFDYINSVEVASQGLRTIAIILALRSGLGLVALAVIQLSVSCLRGLANYLLSRRLYPELLMSLRKCNRTHVDMVLSFGVSAFLLQASGMLILFSDSIVIGAFLPVSFITFFAIAANLTEYARAPISGITHTLTPWASALEAVEKKHQVQHVMLTAGRLATLVALPILVTFTVRGGSFIGLWMGPAYAEPAGKVLWILSLALGFAVAYQVVVVTMMGISRHAGLVPAFLVEAAANIGLSILWVNVYGIVGVAWGTAVPKLAACLLFLPWYVRHVLRVPIGRFCVEVWVRPAVAIVPFALGSYAIERWWAASNLFEYFIQIGLALPLAAFGGWMFCLAGPEKRKLLPPGTLRRVVRGLAVWTRN